MRTIGDCERLDKLLNLAYTKTSNKLEGIQLALWEMYVECYPTAVPEHLAKIVDHIADISTPELLEEIRKTNKSMTKIYIEMVLPWYKKELK